MTNELALLLFFLAAGSGLPAQDKVEKWGMYELSLPGPSTGAASALG